MAKEFKANEILNRLVMWMARRGVGRSVVLTTTGRKTGLPRKVPVSPIERDGVQYLVSPYGEVDWVGNARANTLVCLDHGSVTREVRLIEEDDGAELVRAYYDRERFPRRFMDLPSDPSVDDIRASAGVFPVFRVVSV